MVWGFALGQIDATLLISREFYTGPCGGYSGCRGEIAGNSNSKRLPATSAREFRSIHVILSVTRDARENHVENILQRQRIAIARRHACLRSQFPSFGFRRPNFTSRLERDNMRVLAINCGSSSIKGKLYEIKAKGDQPQNVASLSVNNIASKGEKVKIEIEWADGQNGTNVDEEGEDGDKVDC